MIFRFCDSFARNLGSNNCSQTVLSSNSDTNPSKWVSLDFSISQLDLFEYSKLEFILRTRVRECMSSSYITTNNDSSPSRSDSKTTQSKRKRLQNATFTLYSYTTTILNKRPQHSPDFSNPQILPPTDFNRWIDVMPPPRLEQQGKMGGSRFVTIQKGKGWLMTIIDYPSASMTSNEWQQIWSRGTSFEQLFSTICAMLRKIQMLVNRVRKYCVESEQFTHEIEKYRIFAQDLWIVSIFVHNHRNESNFWPVLLQMVVFFDHCWSYFIYRHMCVSNYIWIEKVLGSISCVICDPSLIANTNSTHNVHETWQFENLTIVWFENFRFPIFTTRHKGRDCYQWP